MPEESQTKLLYFQDFQRDIRQGFLQFSRTEQESLENCKVGGKGKMRINDEWFSKVSVVRSAESIYLPTGIKSRTSFGDAIGWPDRCRVCRQLPEGILS
jgi:hypothetical protein